MDKIRNVISQMIPISSHEMDELLSKTIVGRYRKNEIISYPNKIPNEVFFINSGMLRTIIVDQEGVEHTIHFALENQFIADYSNFLLKSPSFYTLQALEETELVIMPRNAVEWGYKNLEYGDRLGRLIAEYYFVYHDNHIRNMYSRTPKERYDSITEVFPDIHNRVPQHMIASYLGVTPVHLSRLKKAEFKKR